MVITTNAMPHHWAFYFQGSGAPISCCAPGLFLCSRCILLFKKSRLLHSCYLKWPFGYQVRWLPYTWTVVLLKLIYVIKVVQHLFLSRVACYILNLADKNGINLIPSYIPTHPNVEADYLCQGGLVPKWQSLPHIALDVFHIWVNWS